MKWHIGCSGFSYKEWKNIFYPPKLPSREWFSYYSSRFSTLELNVTFYRFPVPAMLESWYSKSPAIFSFAVKAPRLITHYKQLNDCEDLLHRFYKICKEVLKEKLGIILFQFPPRFIYSSEHLERIIKNLNPAFNNVVEFRHASWWNKEVYERLEKQGIIFCSTSFPHLPEDVVITGNIAYYRFHGIPKLYYSAYNNATLKKIADALSRQEKVKEVYCCFNNTAAVSAIGNALWLEYYTADLE